MTGLVQALFVFWMTGTLFILFAIGLALERIHKELKK